MILDLQLWEWEHLAVCQMALVLPREYGLEKEERENLWSKDNNLVWSLYILSTKFFLLYKL